MVELGEQLAFGAKAFFAGLPYPRGIDEFDGDDPLETTVIAPCPPHAAHAAATNLRLDHIGADAPSYQRCDARSALGKQRRSGEKFGIPFPLPSLQQFGQLRRQLRLSVAQLVEPRHALLVGQLQGVVQMLA